MGVAKGIGHLLEQQGRRRGQRRNVVKKSAGAGASRSG